MSIYLFLKNKKPGAVYATENLTFLSKEDSILRLIAVTIGIFLLYLHIRE